jgi:hypothetical protein
MSNKKVIYCPDTNELDKFASAFTPYGEDIEEAKTHADNCRMDDTGQEVYIYKVTIEKVAVGKRIWEKE